jgi:catechol 2,3-dioxygenase-like lactoylglutathione lyase family enzyme
MPDAPAGVVAARGLSHVALRVTDLARAVRWYSDILGYDVFRTGPAPTPDRTPHAMGLIGGAGGFVLELLEGPTATPPPQDHTGIVGLSVTVPDADAAHATLTAAGVPPITPVIRAEGWRVLFLRDPDGSIVELVEQPDGAADIADVAGRLRAAASSA